MIWKCLETVMCVNHTSYDIAQWWKISNDDFIKKRKPNKRWFLNGMASICVKQWCGIRLCTSLGCKTLRVCVCTALTDLIEIDDSRTETYGIPRQYSETIISVGFSIFPLSVCLSCPFADVSPEDHENRNSTKTNSGTKTRIKWLTFIIYQLPRRALPRTQKEGNLMVRLTYL